MYKKHSGRSMLLLMASLLTALLLVASAAEAKKGDFSIDFVAAAPQSYNHLYGGGAFDDRTIGVDKDVVKSLEGGDFSCGDIVTYFAEVTVADVQKADTDFPQTIEMDFSFLADATGQSGVGIGKIVLVQVNYGNIEDLIAGENSIDDGISDDGGSTATLTTEYLTGQLFTSKSKLHGTVKLDDLERGETVVVRIDVKLFCDPGSDPTGNLEGALSGARLTYINGNDAKDAPISGGKQTTPFKKIEKICFPALDLVKTVTTAGSSCPGSDALAVTAGDTVKYCYVITNPGSAPLYNVEIVDDRGTSSTDDDFTVKISTGLSDEDGDGSDDDLAAGGTATGEATVTLNEEGMVTNIATARGDDSIIEPTAIEDSDSATVVVGAPPATPPVIKVTKTANPAFVPETGGDVEFSISVTNDGLEKVTIDLMSDTDFDLTSLCPDVQGTLLRPGETCTCEFTEFIKGNASENHVNTVTVVASDDDGKTDTDSDMATVWFIYTPPVTNPPVTNPPVINVDKTANPVFVPETGGDVEFSISVTNDGLEKVTIDSLSDTDFDMSTRCPDAPGTPIQPGDTYTCSFTEFIKGNAGENHVNTVTVVASDDDGKTDTDSDTANVWFTYTPPIISVAKTANPASVPETGGDVEFSISVTNDGLEKVTIDLLSDTDFDLTSLCPDAIGTPLQPGETYTCSFTEFISCNGDKKHVNTVTVVASDDCGNNAIDLDMATVQFIAVPPTAPASIPAMTPIGTVLLAVLLGLIGAGVIRKGRR